MFGVKGGRGKERGKGWKEGTLPDFYLGKTQAKMFSNGIYTVGLLYALTPNIGVPIWPCGEKGKGRLCSELKEGGKGKGKGMEGRDTS